MTYVICQYYISPLIPVFPAILTLRSHLYFDFFPFDGRTSSLNSGPSISGISRLSSISVRMHRRVAVLRGITARHIANIIEYIVKISTQGTVCYGVNINRLSIADCQQDGLAPHVAMSHVFRIQIAGSVQFFFFVK